MLSRPSRRSRKSWGTIIRENREEMRVSDRERIHRTDPVRGGPIRNFANLYTRPEAGGPQANLHAAGASEQNGTGAAGGDPISRGVEVAYQVIEKYIASGRSAAEQLSNQTYAPRFGGDSLQELLQRMLRFQSELVPLWLDMIGNLARSDVLSGAAAGLRNGTHTNGAAPREPHPVAIELRSGRPVRLTFETRGSARAADLASAGLHALEAGKPAIAGIALLPDEAGRWAKVTITIPDAQPAGRYSGVVVDRISGEVHGTLSIEVE
jgi:hypothetical protein